MLTETVTSRSTYLRPLTATTTSSYKFADREKNKRPEFELEKTINNYLKTPAEMDADFFMEMSSARLSRQGINDYPDPTRAIAPMERYINAYSSEDSPSGFMEENY